MDKRDTLAAAALTGLLGSETHMATLTKIAHGSETPLPGLVASLCYTYADAMIKASRSDA